MFYCVLPNKNLDMYTYSYYTRISKFQPSWHNLIHSVCSKYSLVVWLQIGGTTLRIYADELNVSKIFCAFEFKILPVHAELYSVEIVYDEKKRNNKLNAIRSR